MRDSSAPIPRFYPAKPLLIGVQIQKQYTGRPLQIQGQMQGRIGEVGPPRERGRPLHSFLIRTFGAQRESCPAGLAAYAAIGGTP